MTTSSDIPTAASNGTSMSLSLPTAADIESAPVVSTILSSMVATSSASSIATMPPTTFIERGHVRHRYLEPSIVLCAKPVECDSYGHADRERHNHKYC